MSPTKSDAAAPREYTDPHSLICCTYATIREGTTDYEGLLHLKESERWVELTDATLTFLSIPAFHIGSCEEAILPAPRVGLHWNRIIIIIGPDHTYASFMLSWSTDERELLAIGEASVGVEWRHP